MPRITNYFSDFVTGEVAVGTSAAQLPNVPCKGAFLKARTDNTGTIYLGKSGVTAADGSTDTTTGYPLESGEETPFMVPVSNLNQLYAIASVAGALVYVAFKG